MAKFQNDLCFIVNDAEYFLEELQSNSVYIFKLKGSEVIQFCIGCSFVCDSTDTLCMDASRYIQKISNNYNCFFPG